MPLTHLPTLQKFLTWTKSFVKDQLGAMIMFVALVVAGFVYSDHKFEKGKKESEDEIKQLNLRVDSRDKRLKADSAMIEKMQVKIDTLQNKLALRDCTEEMERASKFLKKLEIENAVREEELNRRVQLEKKKTEELLRMKENLKNNL